MIQAGKGESELLQGAITGEGPVASWRINTASGGRDKAEDSPRKERSKRKGAEAPRSKICLSGRKQLIVVRAGFQLGTQD